MKKLLLPSIVALAAILSLSNCKKDTATGPAGPQGATGANGTALTGTLEGYVTLWDQYGARILGNQDGDTVALVGTSTKVVTDLNGFYTIPSLGTGSYNIAVSKPGFGSTMVQNIQLAGGGPAVASTKLSQPSTQVVPALLDSIGPVTGNITVYTTLSTTSTQTRTFILFVGNLATTSSSTANYLIYYTKNVNGTKLSFTIPKQDLYDIGFTPASSTVYFAAYGIGSSLTASAYTDFTNDGRTVFTALSSPASTLNLIVP
jgi:hypothetical protein